MHDACSTIDCEGSAVAAASWDDGKGDLVAGRYCRECAEKLERCGDRVDWDGQPTPEEIADGLALWDEHKPQTGADWVSIAERTIAAGETGEKGTPVFHGLVIATRERDEAKANEARDLRRILEAIDEKWGFSEIDRVRSVIEALLATLPTTGGRALLERAEAAEAALPDPDKLDLLADWIDAKFPDDPHPEVQADLRAWANAGRAARGGT